MFTGIVQTVGKVVEAQPTGGGLRLTVDTADLPLSDVIVGDSIAVGGVCLTAVGMGPRSFVADVSRETISCTTGFRVGQEVNLEKALRMGDRLGGHIVSGHVDGVAEVLKYEPRGDNWFLEIRAPRELARYVARKGSVTIDGVSLTVNAVDGAAFTMNLIPHTHDATSLRNLVPGAKVNLEVDLLARYLERLNEPGVSAK